MSESLLGDSSTRFATLKRQVSSLKCGIACLVTLEFTNTACMMHTQAERDLCDGPMDDMRIELQKQQKRLRDKLAQIAGPEELEAHDKEQAAAGSKRKAGVLHGACNAANVEKTSGISALDASQSLGDSRQSNHVSGMTNEQLAHELLLDPGFSLQEKVRGTPSSPKLRALQFLSNTDAQCDAGRCV